MLEIIFGNVVEVTLTSSIVIILLLTLSKVLNKHFTAKWRYWLWLIIALRLVLPFNFTLASPPVQLPAPEIVNIVYEIPAQHSLPQGAAVSNANPELNNITIDTPVKTANSANDSHFQLTGLLWIIWIAGASIFILWHLFSYALFIRLIKSSCTIVRQTDVVSIYEDLCREMKIKLKMPLMTCKQISSPLVLGIWKQVLLLPDVAFSPQQLKMVLCHELIHVKRRDILYKSLFLLVRAIHWFNPIVHLLAVEANKDVEASCDAAVVENLNISLRKEYSEAILLVIHNCKRSQVVFSTHFGGGKFMIMRRLESLFDMSQKRKGIVPLILIILIIGIIGLCISCNQNPTTAEATETTAAATTTAETTAGSDPKLIGKWIEEIPADIVGLPLDSIEFFADGKTIIAGADNGTYKIVSGKLQCAINHEVYTGDYEINGSKLTIFKDNGEFKVYTKTEATWSDPKLIGKWIEEIPADIVGLPLDSIEFFADGTAIVADFYNGTYKIVDGKLQCAINHEVYAGEYEIDGTKLTIFTDKGEFKDYTKAAANESDPELLGKWVEETAPEVFGLPLDSIEFLTDGKAIIADVYHGTYKIVNGKLQCAVNHAVYTGKYEIDGTKLTIYKDNGELKVYIKES